REVGFGITRPRVDRVSMERRNETSPAQSSLRRHAGQIERGRQYVDHRDQRGDTLVRTYVGAGDDQRHTQNFLVQQVTMLELAVVLKSFAVIRNHDDVRPIGKMLRFEVSKEPTELPVLERNSRVVRLGFREYGAVELVMRAVRKVRIVEMDPRKKWLRLACDRGEPCERSIDDHVAGTVNGKRLCALRCMTEVVVVNIETAAQTVAVMKDERRDECCGVVSPRGQRGCRGRNVRRQRILAVDVKAVLGRIE